GTQVVDGRKMYVIAYSQVPAKTSLYGTFAYGKTTKLTYTQGMAWVDAASDEITRIISDLLQPVPEVNLYRETTGISFNEVQFKSVTEKFWLPQGVTVSLDWNGRKYRNQHAYSEFLVSDVESIEKIQQPKLNTLTPVEEDQAVPNASVPKSN